MFVQFYNRAIQTKIDEAGLPFYENQVYVIIARDATNQVDRRCDENDIERFPEHYRAFEKASAKTESVDGLVLEMWAMANAAEVANLKSHGFQTVQQLAATDKKTQSAMPGHIADLVNQAKNYVAVAGDIGNTARKIKELSDENESLRDELGIARSRLSALEKEKEKA